MQKDMQVMIITTSLLTQKNVICICKPPFAHDCTCSAWLTTCQQGGDQEILVG